MVVAPIAWTKSYKRGRCQSVSQRQAAQSVKARPTECGTNVPTCGMDTTSGESPRRYRYGATVPSERNIEPGVARAFDGALVSRVRVAHHADGRIVPEHALDALRGRRRPVAHDHD